MDEAIAYAIMIVVVGSLIVAAIAALIGLILSVGLFLLLGIAGTGAVCGLGVGARNFVEVVREAHQKVSR